jgi:uncharacterized zinc-type alcohol dehydrogenase-like protein
MTEIRAYSAASATSDLAPDTIQRRQPTDRDVQIEILFCGVCHSDLHTVRDEWSDFIPTTYPCVPGHEIVGRVTAVGSAVTRFNEGDLVGVGCIVDSDHDCPSCAADTEQFCPSATFTYNSPDAHLGGVTYGATPSAWSWTRASSSASLKGWIRRAPRRCCAPASPPTSR